MFMQMLLHLKKVVCLLSEVGYVHDQSPRSYSKAGQSEERNYVR